MQQSGRGIPGSNRRIDVFVPKVLDDESQRLRDTEVRVSRVVAEKLSDQDGDQRLLEGGTAPSFFASLAREGHLGDRPCMRGGTGYGVRSGSLRVLAAKGMSGGMKIRIDEGGEERADGEYPMSRPGSPALERRGPTRVETLSFPPSVPRVAESKQGAYERFFKGDDLSASRRNRALTRKYVSPYAAGQRKSHEDRRGAGVAERLKQSLDERYEKYTSRQPDLVSDGSDRQDSKGSK